MTPTDPPPAPPRFARPLPQVSALSYATAPKAHTYRAIIQVFFEAKQHYLIELRPRRSSTASARAGSTSSSRTRRTSSRSCAS